MTKRSIFLLWLVALALGTGVFLVKSGQDRAFESNTERTRGDSLFTDFPADKVASISIKSADSSVTLAKGDDGWTVADRDDYPANASRINELLRTLIDVKITQGIEAGPSYDSRFGMDASASTDEDHGLQLTMLDASGAQVASVALGKQTASAGEGGPFGMGGGTTGRHVRNRAEENAIYVTSETFPRVAATPKDWLQEDFVKVEKVKSIAMAMPNKQDFKPWKLTRTDETAEFTLDGAADGEALDTAATNPLKSIFSYARFEDLVSSDKMKTVKESPDAREVTIGTVEGFTYTILFAPAAAEEQEGDEPAPAPADSANFLMTVSVKADIPTERKKADGKSEQDAKTKDQAFATRSTELKEKLATEQKLDGRVFEVTKWTIDALTKTRDELIKKDTPAATTPPFGMPGAMPGMPGMPPGAIPGMPPGARPPGAGAPPRRRIEAVTPPIAVPPLPKPDDKPETDKPEDKPAAKPEDKPPGDGDAAAPPERAVDQPKKPEIREGAEPAEPAAP